MLSNANEAAVTTLKFSLQNTDLMDKDHRIVDVFDMQKTLSTASKDDHDFIRFRFPVEDCSKRVSH